jgi:hypothetical protein
MRPLPENQQLKPENEPENCLKIQLPLVEPFALLEDLVHLVNRVTQNPPPFPSSRKESPKTIGHSSRYSLLHLVTPKFFSSAAWAAFLLACMVLQSSAVAPPFALRESAGRWQLISPQGRPFFSRGVCMVTPGTSHEEYDGENPSYAYWKTHRTEQAWADVTLKRLHDWRFTTIGAWSETNLLQTSPHALPVLTPVLHLGSTVGAPWWDMWDDKIIERMHKIAAAEILPVRDNPRLLGYYTDNEMGWWNATLFHMALEQPASSGQRQRLLKLLREHYTNSWEGLCADFDVELAENWDALEQRGQLWLKPGGSGIKVMRKFLALAAGRYYQLVHDVIRTYDKRALILGDRYQSFYYPEVAKAAAPWVDAISSNLNANWNDGTFLRYYLDTLHSLTGKPVFISEFYMAAMENRTGNKNSHGVFPLVDTQRNRARSAVTTLRSLAQLPYVVGADWFQYYDEPKHGRADGENYNFGLVDIRDEPYGDLTHAFARLNLDELRTKRAPRRFDASEGVPRAPDNPFENASNRDILRAWDRERGFVKCATHFPLADLYICWSPQAIYLGLHAYEIVEDQYYRNQSVPKIDRALWTIETPASKIEARIGAGREPLINDESIRIENQSGLNLNVHNIAIIEIPAAHFAKQKFSRGDKIDLNTTLVTHARAYRYEWRGTFTLR